jgi:hypothetical protein
MLLRVLLIGLLALGARIAPAAAQDLAGHRATYILSLSHDGNTGQVAAGQGLMAYELKDVCDGWAMNLKLRFDMAADGGETHSIQTTQVTWESKDGKSYRYLIKNGAGDQTEQYRGEARLDGNGRITVTADLPTQDQAVLPAGTLFPLAHTRLLLKQAAAGETAVNVPYFDGTASINAMEASAIIAPGADDNALQLKFPALKGLTAYPIDLAFYLGEKPDAMPDSEQFLRLFSNGVMGEFSFSLGNIRIKAALDNLQMAPAPGC